MNQYEAFVRERARFWGIDPDTAVRVAMSEGGLDNPVRQSDIIGPDGKREQSYGFFQLNMNGLGAEALKNGIDPRDPNQWQAATDFALSTASKVGWTPWHGAKRVGIGPYDGIGRPSAPATATTSPSGVAPAYNSGPTLAPTTTATSTPAAEDEPIALVPTRERTLADDFADAYDGSAGGRRPRSSNPSIIPGPIERQPPPEFEFASANAEVEGQAPPAIAAAAAPPLAADASLADLFKVGDIGMAGKVDPVTGLPVLYQGRRAYG